MTISNYTESFDRLPHCFCDASQFRDGTSWHQEDVQKNPAGCKNVSRCQNATCQNILKGCQNGSCRDETRSKNSAKKLGTPEGNSQLGKNCTLQGPRRLTYHSRLQDTPFQKGHVNVLPCRWSHSRAELLSREVGTPYPGTVSF